jgi:hypothetical protein
MRLGHWPVKACADGARRDVAVLVLDRFVPMLMVVAFDQM